MRNDPASRLRSFPTFGQQDCAAVELVMATCPECEFDEIDTEDYDEGDAMTCPECGKALVYMGSDDVELADADDDLDDLDDEDEDEEEDGDEDEDDLDDVDDEDEDYDE